MGWFLLLKTFIQGLATALGLYQSYEERKAGAALNNQESTDAENKRVSDSVDAGITADRVRTEPSTDPNNRDRG